MYQSANGKGIYVNIAGAERGVRVTSDKEIYMQINKVGCNHVSNLFDRLYVAQ